MHDIFYYAGLVALFVVGAVAFKRTWKEQEELRKRYTSTTTKSMRWNTFLLFFSLIELAFLLAVKFDPFQFVAGIPILGVGLMKPYLWAQGRRLERIVEHQRRRALSSRIRSLKVPMSAT
ncbi:MAG: hypothetical protein ABI599_05055 [Flavobacteriales bacterium]